MRRCAWLRQRCWRGWPRTPCTAHASPSSSGETSVQRPEGLLQAPKAREARRTQQLQPPCLWARYFATSGWQDTVTVLRHAGPAVARCSKLLPPGLVSAIQDGPGEAAVVALGQASESPERVWNRSMREAAAEEIAHLAAAARAQQVSHGARRLVPREGASMRA